MARTCSRIPLDVFMNGRLVGRLTKEPSGAIDFRYDPTWLDWQPSFGISLSLPLREDRYVGERVTAAIENLLPDQDEVRRRIAERVDADGSDAFDLLSAIGHDCVGALQFLPADSDPGPVGAIEAEPIDDDRIAKILRNLENAPLGLSHDDTFRISIAGAQEKTALLFWKNKWHVPHGITATTHIFKPQIGLRNDGIDLSQSVENEFFSMRLVGALGLPVADTEIVDFADQRVLVVERFDRTWTRDQPERLLRRPQEDCCQALSIPPSRKYQAYGGPSITQLLELLKGSDHPGQDQRTIFKAQMVFWLLGAIDGHAKNFSVFLHPCGGFELTPLYDVLSVQPSLDARQIPRNQTKLAMSIGDNRHYTLHTILPRHFEQTRREAKLPVGTAEELLSEIAAAIPQAIEKVTAGLPPGFPLKISDSIIGGIEQRMKAIKV